jgi:hypothetical protein
MLTVDPHPLLDALAFTTEFPAALGEIKLPDWLGALLSADATSESAPLHAAVPPALRVPLRSSDEVRSEVRDLLRHGGYKPTGRGKPASEYLIRAVSEGALSPINAAVDVCNIVSLHGGLPISVIDLDRAQSPFRIGVAPPGESYVFNASGQTIDLEGLLCLFDAEGPCANAVKPRDAPHPLGGLGMQAPARPLRTSGRLVSRAPARALRPHRGARSLRRGLTGDRFRITSNLLRASI